MGTRTLTGLVAACLAVALLGAAPDRAAAKVPGHQVTHFRVYDTGPGIAWEMRICTTRRMRLNFQAESYLDGDPNPRYDYGRGTQSAGCRLWRLETVGGPDFRAGRWRSQMIVGFGSNASKATKSRRFRVS